MAKQSWKQQMYQQIANSQVQQVIAQQRADQLQNDFANWQKQQNDIAQLQASFNEWKSAQPAQETPAQTVPVQTVKKEEPKQEAIPSLANYRTADNLQYRQAKRDIALGKKRREDYQRQQQEEAMLSSNRVKKETTPREKINNALNKQNEDVQTNSVRDMFEVGESAPSNNIRDMFNQVPEKKPDVVKPDVIKPSEIAKAAEEEKFNEVAKIVEESAKDWAPWFTYQGSKWENPYDSMTPEQQQIVKDYVQQNKNNPNLSEDERKRLGDFLKVYGGSGESEDFNEIATAYNNSFSDKMQALRAGIGGFVDFNKPIADVMAKGFTKLPGLNQIDLDEANTAYDTSVVNAMDKNRAAAEIGRGAGQIYDYLVTSPVVGAATAAMGIGGVGASVANQVFQAGQDVALDIWPEAQRMLKEEGQINWGELAKRFGTDVAMNFAMEFVPSLRGVNYDYLTKTVGNNADIFKNMTQSGAYKTIPDIANSIANAASDIKANEAPVENVAKMQMIPGMETESAVVDDINRQFSDLMGSYRPDTSAMRNIYNADDLNNSLNEQLANVMRASQADEAIESAAKAMPEAPVNEVANNVDEVAEAVNNISPIKNDIDDMSDAVTNRILDVGYKVDAANNEVLNQSYRELLDYEEKWAKTISESSDIAEIRQATKDLNNAISRFNTRAKKVDPSIAKDIYNKKFSSMLNSFNNKLDDFYNGARRTEEATNLIVGDTGAKNTIEDMARQQVAEATNGFPEELKKLVEDRRHAAWEYGWAEGESVFSTGKRLDNIDKQIKEKYPEYVSQIYDDRGYFKNDLFDVEAVKDRLSKTMAEDTGIPKGTPEPESVKATYQIPDTPENAPTEVRPSVPDEAPNMKVSEAYTNTGRRGGGWNEAEYNKYTNPDDYLYESIDEVRSIEEATNMRLNEGRTAFKNRVLGADRVSSVELDGLMMEWRELTEEARALEEAGKDATDLWAESNKIFRKVQEQSTNNAQALQSLAKWSRNTPEGMLINAENIVNGKNKVAQSDLQKFIEKHFKQKTGNIEFSPEFEKQFLETAEPLRGLSGTDLDTREAKEIMAKLGKMVNEQLPIKLNEKLQSFLMDNMLGNFRTLITRNAGGNLGLNAVEQVAQRPLAAGLDSLVSLKTGRRTQAGLSKAGLAEYISGFGKGLADEVTDFKTGLHTARAGENTLENAIRSNRHVFRTRVADGLDGLVKHGLSVGDRPYYEAVYKQTLGDYYRLRARGLMGEQIQALSDADFKLYAETAAKMNGLGAVYQQDSMLSNALMGFKKDVGMLSNGILGVDILSQFSMPFVKTPANVIERAIDYSPLGLIRNAFRTGRELSGGVFDQNRFVNESARNILGTAMMGGGAAYAANGGLSGGYSDNANEKQAQREAGMQEYAWNVPEAIPGLGGKQMDISWLPVVGSNLVASAAAVDEFNKGEGSLGENLTQGIQAGGEALFDQSMFQGLQRLFGTGETYNSDEGIVGNMKNVVTSGAGQAIPSLLRQIAQVSDEYQRDTSYSNKGTSFGPFNTYAINSLANNIPGLRESYLAPRVDTSGNLLQENQGRNLGMKILEDMILPGKITDVNMSPLAKEASRLSGATENAFIPKAKRDAIDSEEHTLTNEEWTKYQQNYYQQMTNVGNKLIDGDIYKNADEDAQAKILHDAYGAIRSALTSEYTGKEVTGAAKAYKEAGGGDKGVQAVVNYYNAKQLTDEAGLSSTSKAAKEIQEDVASGNTTAANQKADEAATILNAGINAHGYDVYKANKGSIKDTDNWISEYNKIDALGNSDGFVNQEEFIKAIKKNGWSESEAVKYAKIYGTWSQIPYLKKDGTWGFHKKK